MSDFLFGPDSMMWKINRESVLLLGGRGALLMQVAHPLVAAGVADHSGFPHDSFGRLRRTLDSMLSIVFGTRAKAEEVAARVRKVHESVRGIAPDGRPYDARRPDLLLWVHSTLVDSSLRTYEMCVGGLTEPEIARYYEETKTVARLFGIPDDVVPPSLDGLRAWMDERIRRGDVVVTPQARAIADAVLRPVRVIPAPLARRAAVVTAALLPEEIRAGYDLKLGRAGGALLSAGAATSRTLLPLVPTRLRQFPAARGAARRRAARGAPAGA